MFLFGALLAATRLPAENFTVTTPAAWTSASMQQKQHGGWVLLKTYSFQSASGPESIEISRGPLHGLSIGDYAYLEVERIKHDVPDAVIDVDHEQTICGNDRGWVLTYHHYVDDNTERVYETLVGNDGGSYRAVYAHADGSEPDRNAIAAVNSLCTK